MPCPGIALYARVAEQVLMWLAPIPEDPDGTNILSCGKVSDSCLDENRTAWGMPVLYLRGKVLLANKDSRRNPALGDKARGEEVNRTSV